MGDRIPETETRYRPSPPATSLTLLDRLRSGDQTSWERLVILYGPLVYSWSRQAGLSPEDASDAAQEVFSSIWKNLAKFRREQAGDSFRKWLKTVTLNRARDFHRRANHRPQAPGGTNAQMQLASLPQQQPEPPAQLETREEEDPGPGASEQAYLLRKATEMIRDDFEPKTWQAFWQTAVDGRAAPDVAADLGLTANAVRIAKSRVRSRLREEMEGLLD